MRAGFASAGASTARGDAGLRHAVATETATHADAPARTAGGVGMTLGVAAGDWLGLAAGDWLGLTTGDAVGRADGAGVADADGNVAEGVEPPGPTWPTGPQAENASSRQRADAARMPLISRR